MQSQLGRIFVINLDRSHERFRRFMEKNRHLQDVERFSAFDGADLDRRALIDDGLVAEPLSYKVGTLGCALSHVTMWKYAVDNNVTVTISEDDTVYSKHFYRSTEEIFRSLAGEWDYIHWGFDYEKCFIWVNLGFAKAKLQFYGFEPNSEHREQRVTEWAPPTAVKLAHCLGTFCYTVSPKGARALLDGCVPLTDRNIDLPGTGFFLPDLGIDVSMCGVFEKMRSFACFPPIVIADGSESVREMVDENDNDKSS